jgi:hypothetical protein
MPPTLHGNDISDAHTYLAKAWPQWTGRMDVIKNHGGPWPCQTCQGASLLSYRCSKCGAELPEH